MARKHYAIEHRYGSGAYSTDPQGLTWLIGRIYAWRSRQDRDAWVRDSTPYSTNPGYREALSARVRDVRREIASGGPQLHHPGTKEE